MHHSSDRLAGQKYGWHKSDVRPRRNGWFDRRVATLVARCFLRCVRWRNSWEALPSFLPSFSFSILRSGGPFLVGKFNSRVVRYGSTAMIVPPGGKGGIRRGMVIFQRKGDEPTGEILKWVIFHRGHGQLPREMSRSGMYFSAEFNVGG